MKHTAGFLISFTGKETHLRAMARCEPDSLIYRQVKAVSHQVHLASSYKLGCLVLACTSAFTLVGSPHNLMKPIAAS